MRIPQDVIDVITTLESAGYEAWAVGGCVRDNLLGQTPKDYDVASLCPPESVSALFPRCIHTGLAYGTVTVLTPFRPVEVTVFRREEAYLDSRHPSAVTPAADIVIDLSRRDFTVNAMAWHPERGVCDPFGGQADLLARQIRAVGDPITRFREDALRILRCLRFASQLDFTIEANTLTGALALAPTLSLISAERIQQELSRLLTGRQPEQAAELIKAGGLASYGLHHCAHAGKLKQVPSERSPRLAALLWLCLPPSSNTAEDAREVMRRLRVDNNTIQAVTALLFAAAHPLPTDSLSLKRAFAYLAPPLWPEYLAWRSALMPNTDEQESIRWITQHWEEVASQPWNRSMLAVTGNDLKAIGIDGVDAGTVIHALLEQVLQDPARNKREYLLAAAQKLSKESTR